MSIKFINKLIERSSEAFPVARDQIITWSGHLIKHPYSLPITCVITNVASFTLLNLAAQKLKITSSLNQTNRLLRNLTTATVMGTAVFGVNTLFSKNTNLLMSNNTLIFISTAVFVTRLILATCLLKPCSSKPKDDFKNDVPVESVPSAVTFVETSEEILSDAIATPPQTYVTCRRKRRRTSTRPPNPHSPTTSTIPASSTLSEVPSNTLQLTTGRVEQLKKRFSMITDSQQIKQQPLALATPGLVKDRCATFSPRHNAQIHSRYTAQKRRSSAKPSATPTPPQASAMPAAFNIQAFLPLAAEIPFSTPLPPLPPPFFSPHIKTERVSLQASAQDVMQPTPLIEASSIQPIAPPIGQPSKAKRQSIRPRAPTSSPANSSASMTLALHQAMNLKPEFLNAAQKRGEVKLVDDSGLVDSEWNVTPPRQDIQIFAAVKSSRRSVKPTLFSPTKALSKEDQRTIQSLRSRLGEDQTDYNGDSEHEEFED